ncbi:MAG: hypothetical protein KA792_09800, partial [Bacteroidales bacterium]|nr:hypothetical protein [Bacteroidales bacterium]
MRKTSFIIAFIIVLSQFGNNIYSQQEYKYYYKYFQTALKLFSQEKFEEALVYFKKLDSIPEQYITKKNEEHKYFVDGKPVAELKILLKYHIGICYLNRKYEKAKGISYLEFVLKTKYPKIPEDVYNDIGTLYHLNYQFDRAVLCFEKYLEIYKEKYLTINKSKDESYDYANRMLQKSKNAQTFYNDSLKIN